MYRSSVSGLTALDGLPVVQWLWSDGGGFDGASAVSWAGEKLTSVSILVETSAMAIGNSSGSGTFEGLLSFALRKLV
jgi:hypothetical protein